MPDPVTVCQPVRESELPIFECTRPVPDAEYTLSFDKATTELVCMPKADYVNLKNRVRACPK